MDILSNKTVGKDATVNDSTAVLPQIRDNGRQGGRSSPFLVSSSV